jgi:hypothetical protein
MCIGESAQNVQDSSSEENNVEEVSCIAKFRPCKDWRGEYGFDWVREGPDDYEEKMNVGFTYVKEDNPFVYLIHEHYVESVTYETNRVKNNGAWSYKVVVEAKENANGDEMAYECDKEAKYGEGEDRMYSYVELEGPDGQQTNNSLLNIGEKLLYPIYDDDKLELESDSISLNGKKNKEKKTIVFRFRKSAFVFKYFPQIIVKDTNGAEITEQQKSINIRVKNFDFDSELDDYVEKDFSYNYDLQNNTLKWDEGILKKNNHSQGIWEEYESINEQMHPFTIKMQGYSMKVELGQEIGEEEEKNMKDIEIKLNDLREKKDSIKAKMTEEAITFWNERIIGAEELFDKLLANKEADIAHLSKDLDNLFYNIKIIVNRPRSLKLFDLTKNPDVNGIVYNKGEKEEEIEWYGHKVHRWREVLENQFRINDKIVLKNKDGSVLKDGKGHPIKYKYIIPILSIGDVDVENTVFDFRWIDSWTPKKKAFKPSEGIPIQVNLEWKKKPYNWEGSCPNKIVFDTDTELLRVEPKRIEPSKEFTIKLFPDFEKIAKKKKEHGKKDKEFCLVKLFAKGESGDGSIMTIGEMDVVFWDWELKVLPAWFVKVNFDGFGFNSDHDEAIKEQEQALKNALYQAGIQLSVNHGTINIEQNEMKVIDDIRTEDLRKAVGEKVGTEDMSRKELVKCFVEKYCNQYFIIQNSFVFDGDYIRLGEMPVDILIKKFINKYDGENKGYKDQYVVFFLPFSFTGINAFTRTNSTYTYCSNGIARFRKSAYTTAHEVGHDLGLTHIFQSSNATYENKICFGIAETSNIMDYFLDSKVKNGIKYSFRKHQWEKMREELTSHNNKISNNKKGKDQGLKASRILGL